MKVHGSIVKGATMGAMEGARFPPTRDPKGSPSYVANPKPYLCGGIRHLKLVFDLTNLLKLRFFLTFARRLPLKVRRTYFYSAFDARSLIVKPDRPKHRLQACLQLLATPVLMRDLPADSGP